METIYTSSESAPLPGNGATSNEHSELSSTSSTSNEQTPLEGNDTDFNELTPPFGEGTSNSDTKPPIISSPTDFQTNANEVSPEVVQALFSAWQRNSRPKHKITTEFFTTKEIYAMYKAWGNVTIDRRCPAMPYHIAEAVAASIAKALFPEPQYDEKDLCTNYLMEFTIKKCTIARNLLEKFPMIADYDWEEYDTPTPGRYVATISEDSGEQPLISSEFWIRTVDLYDRIHDFFLNPKLQVLLHALLFFWPVSILTIGSKYMECSMGHHLSYLLIILGLIGCLTVIVRLMVMHVSQGLYEFEWIWKWNFVRLIELTFLIVFIVQAFHFFNIDPETEPDPKHCVQIFYNAVLVTNFVSIPLVSVYVLARFVIFCANNFDIWQFIVRKINF